jgi:DNA (cytosine-5)-methyltransferase 1
MKYISLFAGIGGLEHPDIPPTLACELDPACREVLARRYPDTVLHDDITTLRDVPRVDMVIGGWPCQDLSVAGKQGGIQAQKSGLFFRMVDVAIQSNAHTIVGENVPNLLRINAGNDFRVVLNTLSDAGYPFVSWRTLNARQFRLPQQRLRTLLIASKAADNIRVFHSVSPPESLEILRQGGLSDKEDAFGFYWTAGGRSLCWNKGFIPALKVGASGQTGRSAVAVFHKEKVRKLSATECLALQGFSPEDVKGVSRTDAVRMAGNAVPRPMGQFVLAAANTSSEEVYRPSFARSIGTATFQDDGIFEAGNVFTWPAKAKVLASNLIDFLDPTESNELSAQASAGLLVRCIRAKQTISLRLFDALLAGSLDRTGPIRGSRSNSFQVLDTMDPKAFRDWIVQQSPSENQLQLPW